MTLLSELPFGSGNSSIQIARTSKGEYTWEAKLYFLGNDMRTIKKAISNILKTRKILEHSLGQRLIPTEQMSSYLKTLEAQVEKSVGPVKTEPEPGKPHPEGELATGQ